MDSKTALREILKRSGKPKTTISADLGKSAGYVNAYLTVGRAPGADVLGDIAHACGYRLELAPDDVDIAPGVIVIDGK